MDQVREKTIPGTGTGSSTNPVNPEKSTKIWWDIAFRPRAIQDPNGQIQILKYDNYNRTTHVYDVPDGTILSTTSQTIVSENAFEEDQGALLNYNIFVTNHTWLKESQNRILKEGVNGFGDMKYTYNNGFDDIGRPEVIVQDYNAPDYGQITTTPTYTDAGVVTKQGIFVVGPETVKMTYNFGFDDLIRPEQTKLFIRGETQILSQLKYNGLDQVQTKFLGGTDIAPNLFLQKVDYLYDAAGKLIQINTPAEAECFVGQEFCRLSLSTDILSNPMSPCNEASEVIFGENQFTFPTIINFTENGAIDLLIEYLEKGLDENGFLGEVSYDASAGQVIITNTNAGEIFLVLEICDNSDEQKKVPFIVEECCEPSGFNPPVSLGIPTTLNDDLYYQKNTYTGWDITRIELASDCVSGLFRNDYTYDANHRVTIMQNKIFKHPEIVTGRYNTSYQYDLAGNILGLKREGLINEVNGVPNYGIVDNVPEGNYVYENQRLKSVTDITNIDKGILSGLSTYTYDDNGNLKSDTGKEIDLIEYNLLNLPQRIFIKDEEIKHEYTYDGEKIQKITTGTDGEKRVYLGGVEFVGGVADTYSHGDGRVTLKDEVHFQYKIGDHLGNTVVLFEDKNGDGLIDSEITDPEDVEVLQRNLYYPFGLAMEGSWEDMTAPKMNYLYNGKELNSDFGLDWSDYGARYYDASIGRWGQVDPMADAMASWSPYNYTFNNPIIFTDPDGTVPVPVIYFATKFVVGALADYSVQVYSNYDSNKSNWDNFYTNVNKSDVILSGGFSMASPSGPVQQLAASGLESSVKQLADGEFSPRKLATDMIGDKLGDKLTKNFDGTMSDDGLKFLADKADRMKRIADKNPTKGNPASARDANKDYKNASRTDKITEDYVGGATGNVSQNASEYINDTYNPSMNTPASYIPPNTQIQQENTGINNIYLIDVKIKN